MQRRTFLKISCSLGAGLAFGGLGLDLKPVKAYAADMKRVEAIKKTRQSVATCPYCAVGCGLLCSTDTDTGKIINIEGDPEHPVNEGSLCAKGAGLYHVFEANPHRLKKVLYRKPGGSEWEERDWDFAINRIADLIKEERDKNFILKNKAGNTVNRLESLSLMGSSNVLSEECWATAQFSRSLGLVFIDHQARV